jgi:hypothetical protein
MEFLSSPALGSRSRHYSTKFGERVPKTIRCHSDHSGEAAADVPRPEVGGIYFAWTNSYGLVWAVLADGSKLFVPEDHSTVEVVEWAAPSDYLLANPPHG